jgi:hypothetical protein
VAVPRKVSDIFPTFDLPVIHFIQPHATEKSPVARLL